HCRELSAPFCLAAAPVLPVAAVPAPGNPPAPRVSLVFQPRRTHAQLGRSPCGRGSSSLSPTPSLCYLKTTSFSRFPLALVQVQAGSVASFASLRAGTASQRPERVQAL